VRACAQEAWRAAVGMRGPQIVSRYEREVVALLGQQARGATETQREVRATERERCFVSDRGL
jgi:hypothetical protein